MKGPSLAQILAALPRPAQLSGFVPVGGSSPAASLVLAPVQARISQLPRAILGLRARVCRAQAPFDLLIVLPDMPQPVCLAVVLERHEQDFLFPECVTN